MKKLTVLFALVLAITNCQKEKEDILVESYVEESHSYAQPNKAVIKHLDLNIEADFEDKVISGSATYTIENNNATKIILDSKFLDIEKAQADGKDTPFSLGEFNEMLGQSLTIDIKENTKTITVFYKTTSKTEALQWLNPQQTADKDHPFLFTQGQAILTRTWIPIQDSPQIRITYNATVKVPKDLMAVMSAENPKQKSKDGVYHFKMKQPISPYLIALAIGDIEYKSISERTGVYAEKSMIDKVKNEFSDMENMVAAAENLYGDYDWDQFDVIVLPPSFPFGGMENPRLTFATPTVIAGDKSLTSLIAHELAHSWSGNLVTNATWNDFWLNEGFTVYFEIRIMEALYGKDRANMIALIGRQDLDEEIEALKATPEATKLKLDLKGHNPDDGMNSIAYDKGYLFLRTLEETVGREKFDAFLKGYFKKHAFSTITTGDFIAYLNENLLDKNQVTFNTEEWIFNPGVPSNQAIITSDKFENAEKTMLQFLKNNSVDISLTKDWTTQEWVHFIRNFPKTMTKEQMALLDNAFDFTNATNSHIAMVWFEQAINNDYRGNNVDSKIEDFLISVGRRWYVETLFKAYEKNDKIDEALVIYKKSRPNYHSVTANTIDVLLDYKP
ncbi:M1 family metallopeptidase [Ichthyenterobacterium magnum]|uniref:Aminopeptidase N n=1 Tax=Ichthyenterobacterium magnum TaxID=1230530 RepID=A0A420DGG6_9FLAO|nr:M1 family metallopeptidase [Ichthyenterobacterium magnum]RKE92181.1 leukotriene A4 hydrolase-like protein [Ichthyenterobacterium magnum]